MKRMTVEELYDYLCSPQFLDEKSGNIFYNYYIYQYPASNEYEMRRQIQEFREKLERPTNFVNALELDLFKVFCEYLKNEKFGDTSLLDDTFEGDKTHPEMVTTELTSEANSDNFIRFVRDKIEAHMATNDGYNKPYVFIHGIGKMLFFNPLENGFFCHIITQYPVFYSFIILYYGDFSKRIILR